LAELFCVIDLLLQGQSARCCSRWPPQSQDISSSQLCQGEGDSPLDTATSQHPQAPTFGRYIFKSLKSAYNRNADSWMVANPGSRIKVYEIATIFGKAYLQTATHEKPIRGFEVTGLWSYNRIVFSNLKTLQLSTSLRKTRQE